MAKWEITQDYSPGYVDKPDVTQLKPGALIRGSQNVVINDADRISSRKGSEEFGAGASVATTPITSLHTFKKRDGTNIMMRAYAAVLEYYHTGTEAWENLNDGYTSAQVFGFADHTVNTESNDFVYFGNAAEDYSRWTGEFTQLNGALSGGEGTVTVDSTTDFASSGTIRIGTTDVTYSGKTATTFTGCSGTPAASDNDAVTQAVTTYASNPKGNIFLVHNTRMVVGNVKDNEEGVYYSAIADATDFTFSSPRVADEGGIADSPEGGGGITGLALQEDTIFIGKDDLWKTFQFTQSGTAAELDIPILKPLMFSVNNGPSSVKAVFNVDKEVYYVSKEGAVKSVTRAAISNSVDPNQLSDPIANQIKDYDFTDAAGIFYKQKAYIACRTSSNVTSNDVVLVFNFQKRAWEAPIVGWNASSWTIYNGDLYFGSSLTDQVYKAEVNYADDDNEYKCIARFAYNLHGVPHQQKTVSNYFVEGYIGDSTTITLKMRYNYLGSSGEITTTLAGTESTYIVATPEQNVLGSAPLGTQPLAGSSVEEGAVNDLNKFRVYLRTPQTPFHEASFEVSSTGVGQQWEILRHGPLVELSSVPSTLDKKWA